MHSAGEDYVELSIGILLEFGESRKCVGIVILEDFRYESDESFTVIIEEVGASADVTILDDDGKKLLCYLYVVNLLANIIHVTIQKLPFFSDTSFSYIGDSPIVSGSSVSLQLSLGKNVKSARCALLTGNRVRREADCEYNN